MSEETLNIYDEDMKYLGISTRKETHLKGYWHITFHCWIFIKEHNEKYLLFQKRHPLKDTNPSKFAASAAGHISNNETIIDGVRELEEELGIIVDFSDLISVGVHKSQDKHENIIDNEFNYIFLYESNHNLDEFKIQNEELIGLVFINVTDFENLIMNKCNNIPVIGYEYINDIKQDINYLVTLNDFSSQNKDYYNMILNKIKNI